MRCKQTRKSGYKVQAFVGLRRQVFGIGGGVNNLQLIAEPLNRRTRVRHGTFQGKLNGFTLHLVRNSSQETMGTGNGFWARVHPVEGKRRVSEV